MNDKITVIHHSADYDGIFCREIARKFLPSAELIGWDFADKPLQIPAEGNIYILDLPVDRVFGLENFGRPSGGSAQAAEARAGLLHRLVWIDHHKSSIETHPTDIAGYRIDGVAACRLAWVFFDKQPWASKQEFVDRMISEPLAVRLAGEYDIWDKRDPRAETFQFGLRSRQLSPDDWGQLLDNTVPENLRGTGMDATNSELMTNFLLTNGQMLQAYQQRNDAGMMHRSFLVEWEGLKFLALTTARCNSLTFAAKDVPETGHDALMGLYFDGQRWNVSLYHAKHNTGIDLSLIAVKHGGGGHRGACGFRAGTLPFLTEGN